jgi:diguanylate cyclase
VGGVVQRERGLSVQGLSIEGVLVPASPFGPFDLLSDWAHDEFLTGYSERAVLVALEAMTVVRAAGDVRTLRYLHYTCALALIELRRWDEAIAQADQLLAVIDPGDWAWRAKALSLLGGAQLRLRQVAPAVDALAEAYSLVERVPPRRYNEVSAAMAVAMTLGHAQLFEPAAALFALCLTSSAVQGTKPWLPLARVLLLQEYSMLHATWGVALELDGRAALGRRQHLRAAELSLRMMRETAQGDPLMHARAGVVEAYAQLCLGQSGLAGARLRDAMSRFELRPELLEVQIARLGLGIVLRDTGHYDDSRHQLQALLDGAQVTDRVVWELAALSEMALVELAEHGDHPSRPFAVRARQVASRRLWAERESRFFALRDRISLRALAAKASRLGEEALIDPLTGLGNRRTLDAGIAEIVGGAALFLDVDRFKEVNDRHSHAVGDEVLRRIADILRAHCRDRDVVVRFGGDEFVVVLPMTSTDEAAAVGERVRSAVVRERWQEVAPGLAVSVSVGAAASGSSFDQALGHADAALLVAKRLGRNQVVVH